jgi:stigma-specific protein Stig1
MDRHHAEPMSTRSWLVLVLAVSGLGCALQYTVPQDDPPIECATELMACGHRCVAVDEDEDHCGGCGQACALGEGCVEGECVDTCGELDACGDACVDLQSDPANCGGCDSWCDAAQSCVAAECVSSCAGGCDSEEQCIAGVCECRVGFVECADDDDEGEIDCVDLQTDDRNCGECERRCDDLPCGAGECQPADCPGFPDRCEDSCTDVRIDPLNCGECDNECHPSQTCVDGECVSPS